MRALTGYMLAGGNDHDDAPDATTMIIEMVHPSKQDVTISILGDDPQEKERSLFPTLKRALGRLAGNKSDEW